MYDAIMEAHRLNQEVLALQHELLAAARPAPLPEGRAARTTRSRASSTTASAARSARPSRSTASRSGTRRSRRSRSGSSPSTARPTARAWSPPLQVKTAFHAVEEKVVRELILDGHRSDGRGPRDLRPISCEVSLLPRAHGSAIFQRGETQALVTTVLGTGGRRAAGRRDHGRVQQEVHARLQHAVASPSARSARSAAPAAARSATGPWPSARSPRSCPTRRRSPTRSAWSATSSNPTARARWPRSAGRPSA